MDAYHILYDFNAIFTKNHIGYDTPRILRTAGFVDFEPPAPSQASKRVLGSCPLIAKSFEGFWRLSSKIGFVRNSHPPRCRSAQEGWDRGATGTAGRQSSDHPRQCVAPLSLTRGTSSRRRRRANMAKKKSATSSAASSSASAGTLYDLGPPYGKVLGFDDDPDSKVVT